MCANIKQSLRWRKKPVHAVCTTHPQDHCRKDTETGNRLDLERYRDFHCTLCTSVNTISLYFQKIIS